MRWHHGSALVGLIQVLFRCRVLGHAAVDCEERRERDRGRRSRGIHMLCSHSKKFIYFKTSKTAGTSVEIFFERFCRPEGNFSGTHAASESITPAGIVGSRMQNHRQTDTYYNHMPASEIRSKVGGIIFDTYFKFCVVRNPFDKMVSAFWWFSLLADSDEEEQKKKENFARLPFEVIKTRFGEYVASQAYRPSSDRRVYTIDNVVVMDKVIRFERLMSDIQEVCAILKITPDLSMLGSYKRGYRMRPEHYSDYYDSDSRAAIERECSFELEVFGYSFDSCASH